MGSAREALAIEAGTTYEALWGNCFNIGMVAGGGWHTELGDGSDFNQASPSQRIPVLVSSGTSDPEVQYAEAKASWAALARLPQAQRAHFSPCLRRDMGKGSARKHMPTRAELDKSTTWIAQRFRET